MNKMLRDPKDNMEMFGVIISGMKIPRRSNRDVWSQLDLLDIGDSVAIRSKSHSGAYAFASKVGISITVRKVEGGFRVWRIK